MCGSVDWGFGSWVLGGKRRERSSGRGCMDLQQVGIESEMGWMKHSVDVNNKMVSFLKLNANSMMLKYLKVINAKSCKINFLLQLRAKESSSAII